MTDLIVIGVSMGAIGLMIYGWIRWAEYMVSEVEKHDVD